MTLAYGALALILALSASALLSRWYVTPGRRTARPEVNDLGHCPAENRITLHAYHPDGRQCFTCRTFTPGGARG